MSNHRASSIFQQIPMILVKNCQFHPAEMTILVNLAANFVSLRRCRM